jgi:hypothetical protein
LSVGKNDSYAGSVETSFLIKVRGDFKDKQLKSVDEL